MNFIALSAKTRSHDMLLRRGNSCWWRTARFIGKLRGKFMFTWPKKASLIDKKTSKDRENSRIEGTRQSINVTI
jgi:hypothetical protein